ncbi:MAG: TrbG/VirB9 family P-type conjugative transfer protein [Candidatus Sulfotelmatobacter sp.]
MPHLKFGINCVLVVSSIVGALAQESARTVQYHSQDIVAIRAKVKYTTLIELPTTEKIMEAATGDKEFWIVDVVGNFCFVHPAKQGISSNLNLITDKGNIYSFTLQDISALSTTPDLKVIVVPADPSTIVETLPLLVLLVLVNIYILFKIPTMTHSLFSGGSGGHGGGSGPGDVGDTGCNVNHPRRREKRGPNERSNRNERRNESYPGDYSRRGTLLGTVWRSAGNEYLP